MAPAKDEIVDVPEDLGYCKNMCTFPFKKSSKFCYEKSSHLRRAHVILVKFEATLYDIFLGWLNLLQSTETLFHNAVSIQLTCLRQSMERTFGSFSSFSEAATLRVMF
jgi:hypothetical protein